MILLLDVGHSCLTTRADGTCLPLQEGARGVSLIELRAILVDTGDQESDTIGACHGLTLLSLVALTEVDGQIADSLSDLLN